MQVYNNPEGGVDVEFWEDGLSAGEEAAGAAARLLEARSALAQEQERESEYRLAAWPLGF